MARRCELTGIAVQSGNKVSHSNRKTRTRFLPNLVQVTLTSDLLERSVRLRITAAALRSVEHRGGLDDFLTKAHEFGAFRGRGQAQARDLQEARRVEDRRRSRSRLDGARFVWMELSLRGAQRRSNPENEERPTFFWIASLRSHMTIRQPPV